MLYPIMLAYVLENENWWIIVCSIYTYTVAATQSEATMAATEIMTPKPTALIPAAAPPPLFPPLPTIACVKYGQYVDSLVVQSYLHYFT